ncbi:hypothetical protein AURDEDRAFT_127209 [Auricularia subglabra TFB-10046 SS5]|nr:hypothetical protein AURDEDRAFT_127209 [Auricularia subglabra TFB-10046 SS5]
MPVPTNSYPFFYPSMPFPEAISPSDVSLDPDHPSHISCEIRLWRNYLREANEGGDIAWRLFSGSTEPPLFIPGASQGDIYWTPESSPVQVWQLRRDNKWRLVDTSMETPAKSNQHPNRTLQPVLTLRYWPWHGDTKPVYVPAASYRALRAKLRAQSGHKKQTVEFGLVFVGQPLMHSLQGHLESKNPRSADKGASSRPLAVDDEMTIPIVERDNGSNEDATSPGGLDDVAPGSAVNNERGSQQSSKKRPVSQLEPMDRPMKKTRRR